MFPGTPTYVQFSWNNSHTWEDLLLVQSLSYCFYFSNHSVIYLKSTEVHYCFFHVGLVSYWLIITGQHQTKKLFSICIPIMLHFFHCSSTSATCILNTAAEMLHPWLEPLLYPYRSWTSSQEVASFLPNCFPITGRSHSYISCLLSLNTYYV